MDGTSSTPWVLINLLFAGLALAIGFVSGALCFGGKRATDSEGQDDLREAAEKRLAMERALMATGQLHDLATGVATDVGDHSRCIKQITSDLKKAESADGSLPQSTFSGAMTQIVEANDHLQKKLEKAEKQIKVQAMEIAAHENEARTDSLTELANRRAFDDELGRRYSEWRRKQTPFCLVILDVDHFKTFNDTHGHPAGDEVLKEVALAMQASTRDMDIPCRYGGEEFALILPATVLKDAVALAERVRQNIADRTSTHEGNLLKVTASFGVAQIQDSDDGKLLLRRSDEALYQAKDAGRNRVFANTAGQNLSLDDYNNQVSNSATATKSPPSIPLRLLDKLPNRTLFVNQLTQRVAESHRTHSDLSVLAVQVEGYARCKQDYTEQAATLTLDAIAQFLNKTLRDMDSLARVCEDRFAVMLPGADAEVAKQIADRASAALSSCVVPIGNDTLRMDVRISFTSYESMDTAAHILERVETALSQGSPASSEALAQ